jgi:hypothetical protein
VQQAPCFNSNYSILFQGKSKYYFIINIVCCVLNVIMWLCAVCNSKSIVCEWLRCELGKKYREMPCCFWWQQLCRNTDPIKSTACNPNWQSQNIPLLAQQLARTIYWKMHLHLLCHHLPYLEVWWLNWSSYTHATLISHYLPFLEVKWLNWRYLVVDLQTFPYLEYLPF